MQDKEKNLQVVISSRSMTLQQKQSRSIVKWTQTEQEVQLAKAIDGGVECSKFTIDDEDQLLTFIGEWRLIAGDHRKPTDKGTVMEQIMIKSFIMKLYPNLTLPEIKLAVELHLTDKLDISSELYSSESFSVKYCTKVLNAFLRYKQERLIPVLQRREMEPPPEKPYDMKADIEITKKLFEDEYNKFRETGIIYDPMNLCYRFLIETKRLTLYPDQVKAAQEYGATMAAQFLKREDGSIVEAIAKSRSKVKQAADLDIQQIQNRFSRNYCVQEFFRKLPNIEELTHTFTESEFGNKKEVEDKKAKKQKK